MYVNSCTVSLTSTGIYEGGIAKFAGAMIDGKMPDKIEKVTNSSGKTERRITYGGKTYSLQYDEDESGDTKSGITFTEVKG